MLRLVTDCDAVTTLTAFEQACQDRGLSPRTISAYRNDLSRCGVDENTHPVAHRSIAQRIISSDWAPATIRRRLSSLACFFGWRFPDLPNPYRALRRPCNGVVLPATVATPNEARALIDYARQLGGVRNLRTAAAVALMAGTGLRVSEVVNLRGCDINPAGSLRVVAGKGRRTRDVPLSSTVVEVVQEYQKVMSSETPRFGDLLFSCTPRTIQRGLARLTEQMSMRHLHPHALRHGFATAVYRHTTDLRLTADLLGHAHVSTTQIYTHIANEARSAAVAVALVPTESC